MHYIQYKWRESCPYFHVNRLLFLNGSSLSVIQRVAFWPMQLTIPNLAMAKIGVSIIFFPTAFQSSMFCVAQVWNCETSSPDSFNLRLSSCQSKVKTVFGSADIWSPSAFIWSPCADMYMISSKWKQPRKPSEDAKKASLARRRTEAISAGTSPPLSYTCQR